MRILIVTSSFQKNLDEKHTDFMFGMSQELIRKGHDVAVVAAHYPGLPLREKMKGIEVYRTKYFWPEGLQKLAYGSGIAENFKRSALAKLQLPIYCLFGLLNVRKAMREFRPDVVHALWVFPQGLVCAVNKKLGNTPLVINAIGTEAYLLKRYKLGRVISFACNSADAVTSTSSTTREAVRSCGCRKEIPIIFNGVDASVFGRKKSGAGVRKELGLARKDFMVLCVGRMIERKGFRHVIEAMPKVIAKKPDTKLVVVGDGPIRGELEETAVRMGISDNVIFPGPKPHDLLADYYAAADLFIIPSIVDSTGVAEGGQGLVTKEAMLSGTPVIGTSVGGIPDLVINNETGILVPEKSSEKMAQAILRIATDRALRTRLANGGNAMALKTATWDGITDSYLKIYRRISKNTH